MMRLTPAGARGGEAGFTLVEVLVVLALVALLSGALFGAVGFAIKLWDKVTTHSAATDQSLLVEDFLHRTIGAAYPLFVRDDPTQGHIAFAGTQTTMDFVGPTPISRGVGGRSRYHLALEPADGGLGLVVTARPELSTSGIEVGTKDVLLSGLTGVKFSYFGRDRSDPPNWREQWNSGENLPELVRIRINYPPDGGRVWPDLFIALRIDADVSCIYDDLTKRCRGR
jgi:general secretion pathway protein J